MTIDEIIENFEFLDDWDDRYRYLIELGRELEPLPAEAHNDANKVRGCASQVWLLTEVKRGANGEPELRFLGDSDAHIVRGLIAVLLGLYNGATPAEIVAFDAEGAFARLGLTGALSRQRSNGLFSMVERIRREAGA